MGNLLDKAEQMKVSVRAKDGASVQSHQMPVRLHQGALPGTGQEHGATGDPVCAEQFVDGKKHADAKGQGMSAPAMQAQAPKRPEMAANQRQYAPKFSETELPVS